MGPVGSEEECAAKAWANKNCGFGFSYATGNGACDCASVGERCVQKPWSGGYAVSDFILATKV